MRSTKTKHPAARNKLSDRNGKVPSLKGLPPPSPLLTRKSRRLIKLMQSWLEDESGYDEETWPRLQKALKENRLTIGRHSDG